MIKGFKLFQIYATILPLTGVTIYEISQSHLEDHINIILDLKLNAKIGVVSTLTYSAKYATILK